MLQLGLLLGLFVSPQPVEGSAVPVQVEVKTERTVTELIQQHAQEKGVDTNLALAIASCESSLSHFDQDGKVITGVVNPQDTGVFQINTYYHLEDSKKLGFDIFTPDGNIQYAMHLLKVDGSRHWKASEHCWSKKM